MPEPVVFVRLLGQVELLRGTLPVPLARRPAALLAALALRLGTPVSYAAITELLWSPDELPASPRRAIQTYASRLRDALGRDAVVAHGDGLRLDLDPDQVDLHRFRRLAAAATDPATLTEALELWTADPLSGLAVGQLTVVEGPALLDEVLSVAERRDELRLRAGDLDDVFVASLRRLTSEHPWRERSWCHLMLALYRTGQQGEALATFARLVTVLRDDLGIDPGAEATQLHQRMLAGDPDLLDAAPAAPVTAAAEPPAQLPAGSPAFVGRPHELAALARLLERPADRVRVAVVSGPAGVGKTATTVEAAHRARSRFPDGQLFAEGTRGGAEVPARDLLGAFLRDLGVAADDLPSAQAGRAALFRSMCARRRLLLVIDDAHSVEQVTALLPGAGECAVLVTTRRRLAVPANVSVDLDAISATESHELLATLIGADRLTAEPAAAAAIVEACAGSPLALLIVGGRLATRPAWPLAHLRDRLTGPGRLAELQLDGRSVEAALDATTGTLAAPAAARFRALGALPADLVDVETAAALWETGRAEARELLEQLCDLRLLEPAAPECYAWHGLIGSYLRDQPGRRDPTGLRRALRQAIASVAHANERLRPGDRPLHPVIAGVDADGVVFAGHDDVHAWVHPRGALLVGLARDALTSGHADSAVEAAALATSLDLLIYECCGSSDGTEDLLRAVTVTPLPPVADRFVGSAWHNLASGLSDQGRLAEAEDAAAQAIAFWRRTGDRYGEAALLNNLAGLRGRYGDDIAALEYMRQCMEVADALPLSLRARCQATYAERLASHGDVAAARAALDEARQLDTPEPGSYPAYHLLSAEVRVHLAADRPAEAVGTAERAVATAQAMRSPRLVARATLTLARARRLAGRESLDTAAEALQGLAALNPTDLQATGEALAELAHAHRARGDLVSADACAAEAARLVDVGGLRGTPWATTLLGGLSPVGPAG
ncbi:BTAD domain-containing putative transcriptional regulator [Jiangella sp. DSM 45060]|uniref:AfsR/SARP family transcriptional regulator n=1 Tax=Jiangella sp. DSM 45060 TaxID=1798224 RepID=UPI00087AA8E8|nr:BTAD domain-containing putative transcriptional regulator [Jiangella sp. DSM 45060]SDT10426.1 DNA-binding transcriptional activator of the SARP family [Jiangella sp. DSM 45060]